MCVRRKDRYNKIKHELYVKENSQWVNWELCLLTRTYDGADDNFFSDSSHRHSNLNKRNYLGSLSVCDVNWNKRGGKNDSRRNLVSLFLRVCLSFLSRMCLYFQITPKSKRTTSYFKVFFGVCFAFVFCAKADAYPNEFMQDKFVDKINLEQSIAAVFNKVAYGSTTKRSIPDNSYPVTTLATPLLTTYRYSDGSDEWLRVDVKPSDYEEESASNYGSDLEKDHGLPTSAPAADILKNNNNKNYNNPNRYNNDRLRPDYGGEIPEQATENGLRITTSFNGLRNVRPTKSIYSKDVPSYVPPSRAFFTPPLPPEYLNPFADKPTLRGTNSETFANRRPLPPPSLMPNKDRIPFRPDLPPGADRSEQTNPTEKNERKKTLNTPSQNVNVERLGEFYGLNGRNLNESNFEYEKGSISTITRILSGSNGRHADVPDILLKTVTATPHVQKNIRTKPPIIEDISVKALEDEEEEETETKRVEDVGEQEGKPPDKPEGVTSRKEVVEKTRGEETTTESSDAVNLPNVKEKQSNVTKKANSDEVWLICWNVHIYLVVLIHILLAIFSIYKLIRYENDPHMFSKSYFLTVHLLLTVICVLRIFYLTYDPYNVGKSFNIFIYEFLHNFPLSLLATTFAVLILFLLKRTLTHLKVKTRPMFLVVFAAMHIVLCFCLSIVETFGHLDRASLIVCKPVFVLLAWALGFSYLYLYKIIKNVLAKKTQNLSEMSTQNISYASHITIVIAILFIALGIVQLYALFFIKVDRFDSEIKHHWMLWGFELSVRIIEISIIALLAIVVSLRMSQREKQTVGFPLFPCTTSDSSADNIFPNNCTTNPNALNYSRNEMILDNLTSNLPNEAIERPNLLKNAAFQNDTLENKKTSHRQADPEPNNFDRFERPKWGSERFEVDRVRQSNVEQTSLNSFHFERPQNSLRNSRKAYEAKYYAKPKYDEQDFAETNVYSEPIDNGQYRGEFERNEFDRRSKNSSNTSGRRSTGRTRKNHPRPHLGIQTLPGGHDVRHQIPDTMLVDDQGFVRFRHLQDVEHEKPKKIKKQNDLNHYSDA